jgi:hypothetical protein
MSNLKVQYFESKEAVHTWIIFSGWSFNALAGITKQENYNCLCISDYDPFLLRDWCKKNLSNYLKTPYSVLGFSLGALWLSQNSDLFSDVKKCVFVGLRKSYSGSQIEPIKELLQADYVRCVRKFHNQCLSKAMQNNYIFRDDINHLNKEVLELGLTYLEQTPFNIDAIKPNTQVIHGGLDRVSPLKELDFITSSQLHIQKRMGHLCLIELDSL